MTAIVLSYADRLASEVAAVRKTLDLIESHYLQPAPEQGRKAIILTPPSGLNQCVSLHIGRTGMAIELEWLPGSSYLNGYFLPAKWNSDALVLPADWDVDSCASILSAFDMSTNPEWWGQVKRTTLWIPAGPNRYKATTS